MGDNFGSILGSGVLFWRAFWGLGDPGAPKSNLETPRMHPGGPGTIQDVFARPFGQLLLPPIGYMFGILVFYLSEIFTCITKQDVTKKRKSIMRICFI